MTIYWTEPTAREMADSFADLWNSSAPTPSTKPQTLGSISRSPAPTTSNGTGYRRPDAFSMLSSAGGSSIPSTRSGTPASHPKSNGPSPKPATAAAGDAFSGLLSGAISAKPTSQMTMAERAAQAERDRREAALKTNMAPKASSAWDGLDSLGGGPSTRSPASTTPVVDDDWGLGDFGAPSATAVPAKSARPAPAEDEWGVTSPAVHDDGWGMDELKDTRSKNLWDMDEFTDTPPLPPRRRSDSPSNDFNFGDREDESGFLNGDADDILGDLAKPPEQARRQSPPVCIFLYFSTNSRLTIYQQRPPQSRSISPPPHILGRIVEMGFSIQQARVALASTDTGLDVEAALETLLSNGAASGSPNPSPPPALPRRTSHQSAHATQSPPPRARPRDPRASSPEAESNIQEQADKLMAQASQIGLSFFNKANAAWKEGRDRVQKAYAERLAEGNAAEDGRSSSRSSANGRPKWMQSDDGWKDDDEGHVQPSGGFADEQDRPRARSRQHSSTAAAPPVASRPQAAAPTRTVDLFATDNEPVAYVSPFRRGKAAPTPAATPPRRAATPPPAKPLRTLVTASSSSISTSQTHKSQGAEKFKLGQYGEAEISYTRAIECLPAGHLSLVPLYNNRALVRLKTGDYNGAAGDASAVVELVDEGTWRDEQKRSKSAEEGAGVDLGDGLVKAWKRRAEALEGREKWDEARKDWERVAGAGWAAAGMRTEGVRGLGRCKKMINPPPPSAPKPKARPPPRRGPTPPSQALTDLKKANDAAAAEDNEKYELKDSVDARLMAWKGGKETNIRALIASLDSVLWPELGLQKTSIADLVSPGQVKVRYTRAIAKVHPDKVSRCFFGLLLGWC